MNITKYRPCLLMFVSILISSPSISCKTSICPYPDELLEEKQTLKSIMKNKHYQSEDLSLIICKSKYRLYVKYQNKIIKSYPVVFGSNPKDDKLQQGDGCTPEEVFHIRAKYPHDRWSKFMWLDYPNASSYEKFNQAVQNKKISRHTDIGGEVGIHGTREGRDFLVTMGFNWTKGCISLKEPM